MLIVLAAFAVFRAQATPISIPPESVPTVDAPHNVLFGVDPPCVGVRTLGQLVGSCVFTVIVTATVWAPRQNISDRNSTFWKRPWIRTKLELYSLMAPEAILWWGMRQRIGAKLLVEQMNRIEPELKWDLMHGHFAQMGGFARRDNGMVLYPHTLFHLLRDQRINVKELQVHRQIRDKNKFTFLSGFLVALQVTWFFLESLSRLHHGLPLTALEVVALAFTTVNAITSVVWWSKPYNIRTPIYLSVQPPPGSGPDRDSSQGDIAPYILSPPLNLLDERDIWEKANDRVKKLMTAAQETWTRCTTFWKLEGEVAGEGGVVKEAVGQKLVTKGAKLGNAIKNLWITDPEKPSGSVLTPFSAVVAPIWELLGDSHISTTATHVSTFYGLAMPPHYYLDLALPCFVIMIIFGAIHFLSWHATFHTHTQLLLWRSSSIVLVSHPALLLLSSLVDHVYLHTLARPPQKTKWPTSTEFLLSFSFVLCLFGTLSYIVARFCVLVLAFLALRNLPSGALDDVSWTFYIPHF
ncbi:hypothetical protein BDN72DRAFT_904159 [Pluteus cervinus]|uniref:Uncharacterized protein n=1 Tax=Pluteus cervinus TaxID=181527 RepID=A0ACD3A6Q9_9AGAR|nr:hypothetical protein BDN72DRAFT_904159 [Pluteus cervinus]